MRRSIRDFVTLAAAVFQPRGPVIEIGAAYLPQAAAVSDLRPIVTGRPYVGCDLRPMAGVDCRCDGRALPFADQSAQAVIMLEVLEHVPQPHAVIAEAKRVLRPGGLVLASVPFSYPLHGQPHDYWRFTASGMAVALADFPLVSVCAIGPAVKPSTIVAVALTEDDERRRQQVDRYEAALRARFAATRARGLRSQVEERGRDLAGLLLGRADMSVRFIRRSASDRED